MQNAHSSGSSLPSSGNSYSPSVPISLYRQVANELQEAQAAMESIKVQNKQLVEQNQQLRLEIERVVQSALHLRHLADAYQPIQPQPEAEPQPDLEIHFEAPPAPKPQPPQRKSAPSKRPPTSKAPAKADLPELTPAAPDRLLTEQEAQPRRIAQPERTAEVGGWWLLLIIFLIVVTAFGTGFLIVRPLLPNR